MTELEKTFIFSYVCEFVDDGGGVRSGGKNSDGFVRVLKTRLVCGFFLRVLVWQGHEKMILVQFPVGDPARKVGVLLTDKGEGRKKRSRFLK